MNITAYFENQNLCFIDIETTGLSRKNNMIYLIGLLYKDFESNTWILNQYFANSMNKEKEVLEKFISDISSFDKVITYNGDSFDLPFINHRLNYYNISNSIDMSKSFDLYRIIRQNKAFLNLENLKLKTIEESLGFFREDIYSGYDCIGFYYDYVNFKDLELKDRILRHNYDDLVHMLDVITILDVLDEKKSFFINYENSSKRFKMDIIEVIGDMLNIRGIIDPPLERSLKYYDTNYNIVSDGLNIFNLSIEYKEGYITKEDKCIYVDLLEFPSLTLKSNTIYDLPQNIFPLIIEKEFCVENIKNILAHIFKNVII